MFEQLTQAIHELDIPLDGVALVAAHRLADRLAAKISAADGAFDKAGLWDLDAATSMTAWLRQQAAMTSAQAALAAKTAARLHEAPPVADAWVDGSLSGGQVAAITAIVTDRTAALCAEHAEGLVEAFAGLDVTDTVRAMRAWQAQAEALADEDEPNPEPIRTLHLSATLAGRYVLDGSLDTDSGEVVAAALRLATTRDADADISRTPAQRRADALVDVCRHFLDHQQTKIGGRHRPHVSVIIAADDLREGGGTGGQYISGLTVGQDALGALPCDSAFHRVLVDGRSSILDFGMATRDVPANLYNAVALRDRHCRFPGCDRPPDWCDAHHVRPFGARGPTCIANLALLCRRHHVRLHQRGWHAKLLADGTFEVTDASGVVRAARPDGPTGRAAPDLFSVAS
jgi:Domain of unknown function (DUF222)